ncbi:hypothetical protein K439DRAFT_1638108 [Ramaria rubella]|nr:hypothetical protein K439DRAFT_1638108 [Ramaria rubella]
MRWRQRRTYDLNETRASRLMVSSTPTLTPAPLTSSIPAASPQHPPLPTTPSSPSSPFTYKCNRNRSLARSPARAHALAHPPRHTPHPQHLL